MHRGQSLIAEDRLLHFRMELIPSQGRVVYRPPSSCEVQSGGKTKRNWESEGVEVVLAVLGQPIPVAVGAEVVSSRSDNMLNELSALKAKSCYNRAEQRSSMYPSLAMYLRFGAARKTALAPGPNTKPRLLFDNAFAT
eukprot:6779665-Pyramimonas_sp.AAC.1